MDAAAGPRAAPRNSFRLTAIDAVPVKGAGMNILDLAQRSVVSVARGDSIDKAIALMEEHDIHHLPVLEHENVVGIVSDRDILLSVGWLRSADRHAASHPQAPTLGPERVEQIMSYPVVTVTNDDTVRHAARVMVNRKIGALPVVHEGRLVAILSETDLLRRIHRPAPSDARLAAFLGSEVRNLMVSNVASVEPRVSLTEIVALLHKKHARHLPVVLDGELVGIVSDRDVRRALGTSSVRDLQARERGTFYARPFSAMDVMTKHVRTVPPHAALGDAVDLLLEHRIHALPVLQGGELVGIFTQTDVVKALATAEIV